MKQLNGPQPKELQKALLSAYPKPEDLERLVSYGLNENLSHIVGSSSSLEHMVFELLQWAQARGRLNELMQEAVNENPRNEDLLPVAAQFGVFAPTLPPRPRISPPPNRPVPSEPPPTPDPYLRQPVSKPRTPVSRQSFMNCALAGFAITASIVMAIAILAFAYIDTHGFPIPKLYSTPTSSIPTPTSSIPTPTPSIAPPTPSIPQLHEAYSGTFNGVLNGGPYTMTMFSLTEDANGSFAASGYIRTCQARYTGEVQSNGYISFTGTPVIIPGSLCTATVSFFGQLFSDGHLSGTWQSTNGNSGNWLFQPSNS